MRAKLFRKNPNQVAQFDRNEDVAIFARRPPHLEYRLPCAEHCVRQRQSAEFGIAEARKQERAEQLIRDTLRDLPHYANTGSAFAEGYRSIGDSITGDEHYINWAYLSDGRILDSKHPESLVYEMRNGKKTLVAAMYMLELGSTFADVPDVGGALTQWHVHNNLCLVDDPNDPLRKYVALPSNGTCPAGSSKATATPMIHVWIVKNACGPFASLEGIGAGQVPPGETRNCDTAHGS